MLYLSLRYFIIPAAAQCSFLYYNMLVSNAPISLKVQLLVLVMGVCLCLEDGSSDCLPPSLGCTEDPGFTSCLSQLLSSKGWLPSLYVFSAPGSDEFKKPICTERGGALTIFREPQGWKRAEGNLHLSLMTCTWLSHPFTQALPFQAAGSQLCVPASQTHWGHETGLLWL